MSKEYPAVTPKTFVSPLPAGENFEFDSAYTIYPYDFKDLPSEYSDFREEYYQKVTTPSGEVWENTFTRYISSNASEKTEGQNIGFNTLLQSGTYEVFYRFQYSYPIGSVHTHTATYKFAVVENHYPLKKMTIKEVIERQIAIVEPRVVYRNGDYVKEPRFKFGYKHYDESKAYEENTEAGKEEYNLFNQVAPEFTFTRCTLREQLQEIGKFIHAEPRIVKREIDGEKRLVWIYDRYGERELATYVPNWVPKMNKAVEEYYASGSEEEIEKVLTFCKGINARWAGFAARFEEALPQIRQDRANGVRTTWEKMKTDEVKPLNQYPYTGKRVRHNVNTACTRIESEVDNFVNRLEKTGGTVAEPYRNGAITLRTDTAYVRFEDAETSLYFPTQDPIMDITSFRWIDLKGIAGTAGKRYDITPYVFEKTIYDAQLSSYEAQYPYSKAYGLYFTQGEKHIRGFFFKNTEWTGGVFAEYAITNILRAVTGNDKLTVPSYPELCFELVYTPIYGARLGHGKAYTGDLLKQPWALFYNQSANVVETRYYGEHMKGVAQRLGNEEKEVDIEMMKVSNLPKIGQMWDDEFYISSIKGALMADRFLLTLGLTKKFNRLSEYVGANSYKRYYEVSERMAQERRMLYTDYLVITKRTGGNFPKDCFMTSRTLSYVMNTFYQTTNEIDTGGMGGIATEIISSVSLQGYTKEFNPLARVILPVISSALGNVMEFIWRYKDNFSAGTSSVYQTGKNGDKDVQGYFGADVPYCDYYGRMYYQDIKLQMAYKTQSGENAFANALAFPRRATDSDEFLAVIGTSLNTYDFKATFLEERKDSREKLSQAYAIEYVTDMKDYVIGSALARNNPMIGGLIENGDAVLYILPEEVNPFSTAPLDLSGATEVLSYASDTTQNGNIRLMSREQGDYISFKGAAAPVSGKAWAIVSRKHEGEPYKEEDEDGNVTTVTPTYGGELLIAQNTAVNAGDTVAEFNIVPTHDIYEFIKENQ